MKRVLDHGYVRYVKHMGDDLDVVNSARVSFDKASESFEARDKRLLSFLMREEHSSVLRHSAITFEVYAPLMVARQWWKYVVGSAHIDDQLGWNESSRRYLTEEPTFYVPQADQWRSTPEDKKQGSGPAIEDGTALTTAMVKHIEASYALYDSALTDGVCPEQARLFLPAYSLYVRWRWTASLGAALHFLRQRLADDAQYEIQQYAKAVEEILAEHFPQTVASWSNND